MTAIKVESAAIRPRIEDIERSVGGCEGGRGLQSVVGFRERIVGQEQQTMREATIGLQHECVVFRFNLTVNLGERPVRGQRALSREERQSQRLAVEWPAHYGESLRRVRRREIAIIESRQPAPDAAEAW